MSLRLSGRGGSGTIFTVLAPANTEVSTSIEKVQVSEARWSSALKYAGEHLGKSLLADSLMYEQDGEVEELTLS